ncbi:MAG: SRPBCC family protein [Deltaproteobacteria bacterium]|nr:SRPBCC family protein [Deltaproteobacteria bacterium]
MTNSQIPIKSDSDRKTEDFDISQYTPAPLRMDMTIAFEGKTPAEVFEILGNPELIPEWYILAEKVNVYPPEEGEEESGKFTVDFLFFGEVYEEVLHWDPPHRYVYKAVGEKFPIKDYIALIEVIETEPGKGLLTWRIYCSQIEGRKYQIVMPLILPPINEESIKALSPIIGGTNYEVRSYF